MIVTKRLDSSSTWVIHNNPQGKFFNAAGSGSRYSGNQGFLLRQVIHASAAAPHYFEPERLRLAEELEGAFVDGGVSPYNNPALQLLLLATLEGYGFKWPLGADKLLLVSVGTGSRRESFVAREVMDMPAAMLALRGLVSLMGDCDALAQTLLQWMSNSPTSWEINSEIGSLSGDLLGGQAWFSYLRYNLQFDPHWMRKHLAVDMEAEQIGRLFEIDAPQNLSELNRLGVTAAAAQVNNEHFPASFDRT
jgi:hypothetical protein